MVASASRRVRAVSIQPSRSLLELTSIEGRQGVYCSLPNIKDALMEGANSDEAESLSERFSASLTERRIHSRNAPESQNTIDPLTPLYRGKFTQFREFWLDGSVSRGSTNTTELSIVLSHRH